MSQGHPSWGRENRLPFYSVVEQCISSDNIKLYVLPFVYYFLCSLFWWPQQNGIKVTSSFGALETFSEENNRKSGIVFFTETAYLAK